MGKVTNDEKRRVAAALRKKYRERSGRRVFLLQMGGMYEIACLHDLESCLPDGESMFTILADLIEPDTTTDTTKSQTTSLSSSLCERGVSTCSSEVTPKYSEVTPKQGCPHWDGECMYRVTRRVVDVDALLELAEECDEMRDDGCSIGSYELYRIARRIREACGVVVDGR